MSSIDQAISFKRWQEVRCVLCEVDGPSSVVWTDAARGDIIRCQQCGLVYRNPRRQEDEQTRHFGEEWTEARSAFQLEDYRTENLKRLAKWILDWHPKPGAILDIGSSYGTLLEQFPSSWSLFGIEPSKTACQVTRERLPHASIINATVGEAFLPEKSFDVITMVDTIYYLPHPLRDLTRIRGLLKSGGIALVEAPNFANRGPVYRWMRHPFDDTWMYFYTPKSLERILNKVGFKVVDRIDLPGHRIGSTKFLPQLITWAEFAILKAVRKVYRNHLDLVPHFALVAKPR